MMWQRLTVNHTHDRWLEVKAPLPDIKQLMVPCLLGRNAPQQAGYHHCRWVTSLVLYNIVHYGEPRLHYEVSKISRIGGWEVGFHCEAKDKHLNRVLLSGFRRHLFEIKDVLGDSVEAEMWDRGWTKIYEVVPEEELTTAYQAKIGQRMAEMITCLHPIYVELHSSAANMYR